MLLAAIGYLRSYAPEMGDAKLTCEGGCSCDKRDSGGPDLLEGWHAQYLGGWQQSRARDNLINDNFSAFLVKAKSDDFSVDEKEIHAAQWFAWSKLLDAWRDAGKPTKDKDGKKLKAFAKPRRACQAHHLNGKVNG